MSAARRLTGRVRRLRDPGLLALGCVCFVVAATLVALPLGFATAGVSFVVMDLATDDRTEQEGTG